MCEASKREDLAVQATFIGLVLYCVVVVRFLIVAVTFVYRSITPLLPSVNLEASPSVSLVLFGATLLAISTLIQDANGGRNFRARRVMR